MESLLLDILAELARAEHLDPKQLEGMIRRRNKNVPADGERCAKKRLLPYYFEVKKTDPARWASWNVTPQLERRLVRALRMKPGRTASGVATITVLTKPWPCASACLYCPNDVRMPKSYLADEPACQRAERTYFDPYLQVAARLRTLMQMGHTTDKVELIVLGGTWSDYPAAYQTWFVTELFRALNEAGGPGEDSSAVDASVRERTAFYSDLGLKSDRDALAAHVRSEQAQVDAGAQTYNQATSHLYASGPWAEAAKRQEASFEQLEAQHAANEAAAHRAVGLVIETRPDTVTCESLRLIRLLGCTKVQMGVQSLDDRLLALNQRGIPRARIAQACSLLRLFGFKIHVHFMANLYGATPETDKRDYAQLVSDKAFLPDEVKLYPCALVGGTGLVAHFNDGSWRPYTEDELLDVLVTDVLATPPYTRISRMIRDISAHDILVGNKKVNLRQLVEAQAEAGGNAIAEIRHREIGQHEADHDALALTDFPYETSVSSEHFLQWTTPEGRLAGFLRLSLPKACAVRELGEGAPVAANEAMIREVHVYGRVAGLHESGQGAQHAGLGRQLVERACAIARAAGYAHLNVISSVGTREYYRHLGFSDAGLYQRRTL